MGKKLHFRLKIATAAIKTKLLVSKELAHSQSKFTTVKTALWIA
jgi:hypothetical protein